MKTNAEQLADLGFTQVEKVSERDGIECLRIRTSKGWVYERWAPSSDAIDAWATRYEPEKSDG